MLINQTLSIIAIDIMTSICLKDIINEKKLACIEFFFHFMRKNVRAWDFLSHTIGFITIRSAITECTLTHRLIIFLHMTYTSIITNKIWTWIYWSITCRTFIALLTFTSVWCTLTDTGAIIAWYSSTCIFWETKKQRITKGITTKF